MNRRSGTSRKRTSRVGESRRQLRETTESLENKQKAAQEAQSKCQLLEELWEPFASRWPMFRMQENWDFTAPWKWNGLNERHGKLI